MPTQIHKVSDSSTTPAPNDNIDSNDSRCCFHFAKYETFIFIVGILAIGSSIAQIVIIALELQTLHDVYQTRSTYYFCGIGISFAIIVLVWELPLLYFVRKRKLIGIQHWMFSTFLHFIGSCIAVVIAGGVYERKGLFLSMSFLFHVIRAPAQMFFVHKFVKAEKLGEDSHYIAAYYKKF